MKVILWLALAAAVWFLFDWMKKRFSQMEVEIKGMNGQLGNLAQQIALLPRPANSSD